jgi:hypothetical protein
MMIEDQISAKFSENVETAIKLLSRTEGSLTDQQVVQLLYSQSIEYTDAGVIAIFLPIAFCRLLLPNFEWKDEYYEVNDSNLPGALKMFSKTKPYSVVYGIVKAFFQTKPASDILLKIAGRSSEFHAINKLLLEGHKLEEIKLTPISIVF